ncbi:MAG: cobalamin biosynthesis protein [Nitrospirae bacterium]|nr:cobalamin biosynthesis protein [Nitrospirota bacterium]
MSTGNKKGVRDQGSGVRKTIAPTSIFFITDNGLKLAQKLKGLYPDARIVKFTSVGARRAVPLQWHECKNLIFIMATGIVIRTIAPLLKDKKTDPAVIVLDEKGRYAISLLSGHLGGANKLAGEIANFLGAQAVITTASDVQSKIALDIWANERGLYVEDCERLKQLSAKIVNGKSVKVYTGNSIFLPEAPDEFNIVESSDKAEIIISEELYKRKALYLRPRNLFAGIGCNRGTTKKEIQNEFTSLLKKSRLSAHSITGIASIDLKNDEKGLLEFAEYNRLPLSFFPGDTLNTVATEMGIKGSKLVKAATGAVAVSEPAAVLAARQVSDRVDVIIPKVKRGNVTLAIAKAKLTL